MKMVGYPLFYKPGNGDLNDLLAALKRRVEEHVNWYKDDDFDKMTLKDVVEDLLEDHLADPIKIVLPAEHKTTKDIKLKVGRYPDHVVVDGFVVDKTFKFEGDSEFWCWGLRAIDENSVLGEVDRQWITVGVQGASDEAEDSPAFIKAMLRRIDDQLTKQAFALQRHNRGLKRMIEAAVRSRRERDQLKKRILREL